MEKNELLLELNKNVFTTLCNIDRKVYSEQCKLYLDKITLFEQQILTPENTTVVTALTGYLHRLFGRDISDIFDFFEVYAQLESTFNRMSAEQLLTVSELYKVISTSILVNS